MNKQNEIVYFSAITKSLKKSSYFLRAEVYLPYQLFNSLEREDSHSKASNNASTSSWYSVSNIKEKVT
ncbi:5443_t:CDS:2 [Funneliformis caledonium]|uniref:5443_t:CDS:1 n=1 Tax=Funneliformis caledonium TaxID=1117310 RepID=A0A9N9D4J6_9GLOM|nr:5443_t:CDS:2 [Funneliformis caledonium]